MPMASKGARAPKLTPEVQARILLLVRAGVSIGTAFRESGISAATCTNWRRWAEAYNANPDDHPNHVWYAKLFAEVDKANAVAESKLHTGIALRAFGRPANLETGEAEIVPDPELAKWLLTRRFPENYSGRLELTGAEGKPLEAVQTNVNVGVTNNVRGVVLLPAEVPITPPPSKE